MQLTGLEAGVGDGASVLVGTVLALLEQLDVVELSGTAVLAVTDQQDADGVNGDLLAILVDAGVELGLPKLPS